MKSLVTLALTLAVLAPNAAFAHSNYARQTEQLGQIERGRQTGDITWREGLKLRKEQKDIAKVERELAADGKLTPRERRILHKLQNKAQDNIQDKRYNTYHRAWFLPRFGR